MEGIDADDLSFNCVRGTHFILFCSVQMARAGTLNQPMLNICREMNVFAFFGTNIF